jgi:hypothetical protein
LSSLSSRRTCPAEIASRRSGYQSRPCRIIHDLTLGSGFVGSAMADLLGSDFSLAGEGICGGSLITFCSAALTTKSEFWSSAVTIVLGYTSFDVWIIGFQSGHQAVGVEILNLSKRLRT